MTFRLCDECGAALDPGERCDCQNSQGNNGAENAIEEDTDV